MRKTLNKRRCSVRRMNVYRKIILIKYWVKLITLDNQSLLFKTYNKLMRDAELGNTYNGNNWASQIK
jgi:hypothetical protein